MDDQGLGAGRLTDIRPLGGGTQNMMVRFVREGRGYVFRRGPRHVRAATNNSLRREMHILSALTGTPVPHPGLIAGSVDESVLGDSVFYLMEPVDGFNAATELPDRYAADASARHGLGIAAVDALARLGALDHQALGLTDLGRPEGFLERQVPRWLTELESYTALEGYPGPDIPGVDTIADWLEANRPTQGRPGIMHGDFHLANLMFAADRPEVAAIVDWEMCTVGDPLLDLGWLLATWPWGSEANDIVDSAAARAGGLASTSELVRAYAARSSRDLSCIPWYTVLACFKLGIVLEGTYARACAGKAPRAVGERLHGLTLRLFDRAHALVAGTTTL